MRVTVNIDDELYDQAAALCGMKEKTVLIHERFKVLIERESACRLTALDGSEPEVTEASRR
jgi:Arc/MetJ family transcription regulator